MADEPAGSIALVAQRNGGDFERARALFYEELPSEFGGGTASDYVAQGHASAVRPYILSLAAGGAG